jgi:hypothetical protein
MFVGHYGIRLTASKSRRKPTALLWPQEAPVGLWVARNPQGQLPERLLWTGFSIAIAGG